MYQYTEKARWIIFVLVWRTTFFLISMMTENFTYSEKE